MYQNMKLLFSVKIIEVLHDKSYSEAIHDEEIVWVDIANNEMCRLDFPFITIGRVFQAIKLVKPFDFIQDKDSVDYMNKLYWNDNEIFNFILEKWWIIWNKSVENSYSLQSEDTLYAIYNLICKHYKKIEDRLEDDEYNLANISM